MIKITKSYRITFSYAGVKQHAEFRESNGVLVNPQLNVSWCKVDEKPDVTQCKTIDEVLELIKNFSYDNRAEIDRINGYPVFYHNKIKTQNMLKDMENEYREFIEHKANLFFEAELKPLLRKNKWKVSRSGFGMLVLIEKDKNGEWDNVRNTKKEFEFEYLCKRFLVAMGIVDNEARFITTTYLNLIEENLGKFYVEL